MHSTETILLRVSNDILTHNDAGECSVLVLLDLSAAFKTVDQRILIRQWVGILGSALQWFSFYADCSFAVSVGAFASSQYCGVLQGSVLGPVLVALYYASPWTDNKGKGEGISYHC